jgi:transglutaminase-like putative cysteine protease
MSDSSTISPSLIRKTMPWAIGLCFGMLFLFLMAIRLGIWSDKKNVFPPQPVETMKKESWMDIFRHNEKIGYSHRRLKRNNDGFELYENTRLRLNIMGMIQDMRIRTTANLNRNYSLASFAFDLKSGAFDFKVHGSVQNNVLRIFTEGRETKIPLNEPIFLLSSISNPATLKGLPPNITRTFDVFDPSTLGKKQVRVTREGHETVHISGEPVETDRFSMETMGITQSAWITAAGEVVQETGPMGIRLTKSDAKKSAQGFDDAKSTDLTESFSIAANIPLTDQNSITRLSMSIHGAHDTFFLDGGRQTLKDSILTIVKENLSTPPEKQTAAVVAPFLDPSAQIRSDHPMIRHKAAQIVSKGDPPLAKARKIMAWIFEHIEKRPVLSIPDAVKTLENGMGDCNEHAVLFAALARAAGVPAQVEAGLVHMEGRFYYHAWNVIYADGWITVDALMGQMPADVSHIRLIRGDIADQLNIVHAIDQLHLKLLDIAK